MFRFKSGAILLIQIVMTLALVESTDFSTRVEYKQVNAVPKELLHKLEPFKLIGRKYYYNESKELNWFQAAQECRKLGANLINLATNEERQLIGLNLDNGQKYWMDFSNLGQKEYVSISTGSMITYAKWIDEDDSDDSVNKVKENQNCVLLVNDYQDGFVMKKAECLDKAGFICQLSSPRTFSLLIW